MSCTRRKGSWSNKTECVSNKRVILNYYFRCLVLVFVYKGRVVFGYSKVIIDSFLVVKGHLSGGRKSGQSFCFFGVGLRFREGFIVGGSEF